MMGFYLQKLGRRRLWRASLEGRRVGVRGGLSEAVRSLLY